MSEKQNTNNTSRGEDVSELALKIRNKLLVDEKVLFDETLDRSAKNIQLDSTGQVRFRSLDSLRKVDAIALFLLGKKLAKDAELGDSDLADAEESARATGMTKPVAAARLHDLVVRGRAESPERGKFRIVRAAAPSILAEIEINTLRGEHDADK
jgi:hypothetical protein